MAAKLKCPNCDEPVANSNDGCVLHDLIQVVRERGNTPEKRLRKMHSVVDIFTFWNHIGPVIDRLEEGYFSD